MDPLQIRTLIHNSPEYEAEVALRSLILREPLGLSFTPAELAAEAGSHHIGCFIAGELVGCLVLKPIDDRVVQMRQVAVREDLQGRGVGRKLVIYAEELARQLGFQEMILHARATALSFYEALGYTKVGDLFVEVTIPHWSMVKVL